MDRLERNQARALEDELFGKVSFGGAGGAAQELPGVAGSPGRIASGEAASTRESLMDGSEPRSRGRKRQPVWLDDDDEGLRVDLAGNSRLRKLRQDKGEAIVSGATYVQRLRGQHSKLNPNTRWAVAKARAATGGLESEAFLQKASRLGSAPAGTPLPGHLEVTRMRDANVHERASGVVTSLAFAPSTPLLAVGSFDKRLRFFQVDGVKNVHLQSVFLADMPVRCAAFAQAERMVVSGRRRFFYVVDLPSGRVERIRNVQGCADRSLEAFAAPPALSAAGSGQKGALAFLGNEGTVPLVSLATWQWVGELRGSGRVTAASFAPSGDELFVGSADGHVTVWDLRTRRARARFADEGCLRSSRLAVSTGRLAAGSDSGVVNVYDSAAVRPAAPRPQPLRALENLVTTVDTLAFSPDESLLCAASRMRKDALRIVHAGSGQVYANWPTARSPLHFVHCAAFSPGGGVLAVGNAKGSVLTYRLHHYPAI